jgi:hypothetical protein
VVFTGPLIAAVVGIDNVFRGVAALLVAWAIVFAVMARDAPARMPPATFGAALRILGTERLAWILLPARAPA